MDKLIGIYNTTKNKIKKQEVPGLVWVLAACLLVVVIAFFTLPEARAEAPAEQEWQADADGTYKISDITGSNVLAEITVKAGGTYIIDGSGTSKDAPRTDLFIRLAYNDSAGDETNPAKVNVVLRNVNMSRTYDEPLISFTTDSNAVDYHVTIEGECNLTSNVTGTSLSPVVSVEDIQYSLMKLVQAQNYPPTSVSDYVISEDTIRMISVYLEGENTESTLNITAADEASYGAVIGSSEGGAMQQKLNTTSAEHIELLNKMNSDAMGESEISISKPEILAEIKALGFTPKTGQTAKFLPQYIFGGAKVCGAGKVIVGGADGEAPLRLNIVNNGYGASIGGGGGLASSESSANAQKITINAGTVYITSSKAGVNAIGSGLMMNANSVAATVAGIEINGGSILISSAGGEFTKHPVNAEGDKVYLVKADTTDNTENRQIPNIANLAVDTEIPLEYSYEEGLQFSADLDNPSITQSFVKKPDAVNIVDVAITLSTVKYYYKGTGHSGGDNMLYFYLPATETTNLYITDEFGPGSGDDYASYIVKDGEGNVMKPLSEDVTSSDNRKYVLVRGKKYYIIATAPKNLEIKNVTLTKSGIQSQAQSVAGSGYLVEAEVGAITATVNFGGEIDIIYDDGLLSGDEANHDMDGVLPSDDYEYGTIEMALERPGTLMKAGNKNVKDLIFAGWKYVKEDGTTGDITHITKTDDGSNPDGYIAYSDIIWSDGTIHVEATWNIEIAFVVDSGVDEGYTVPETMVMPYGSGTANTTNITLPADEPSKSGYMFVGWYLDDGTKLSNPVQLSTLTSHKITSLFEKDGFRVYIDASGLDLDIAEFFCVSSGNEAHQLLEVDGNGVPKLIDVNGTKYYRTVELHYTDEVKIIVSTETGYMIKSITISADTSKCQTNVGETKKNVDTGNYYVDFIMGKEDVYVVIDVEIETLDYTITFKDGKSPNEQLWQDYTFSYTIEDIANGTTIGDIIRRGFAKSEAELSDTAISELVNSIPKNDRFTTFAGWKNEFMSGTYGSSLTIRDVLDSNQSLTYGPLTFTADWKEYGKVRINLSILERSFLDDGSYEDSESPRYTGKLFYKLPDGTMTPVHTEIEIDETGEEVEIAYASPGDTLYIDVYEMDENGEPVGEPVTEGLEIVQLYYWYESIRGEDGYINVHTEPLTSFNVEDEAMDGTDVDVYLVYAVKKYKIIYWNLYGHDNSMNPTEFTVYDEFDFVPIADGVDWLLVCMDTDSSNDDEVRKEVITGVALGGKPVTDGDAGNRDYVSNLVLMPDWGEIEKDEYTITIIVDGEEYGKVTVAQPSNATSYMADQLILMSVLAEEGYELVPESLVYKKDNSRTTYGLTRGMALMSRELDTLPLQPVNEEAGTYLFTMPESDVIVYASFRLREYNIIYENVTEDMINPNPDKYNINSNISLVAVEKEGYTFEGWYDVDGNKVDTIADRTGDIILIPRYEAVEIEPVPEKPDKPSEPIEIVGRPSNIIVSGNTYKPVQTGDETDVPRLILICVAAVLILLIVIIKKPRKEEDETEGQESDIAEAGDNSDNE